MDKTEDIPMSVYGSCLNCTKYLPPQHEMRYGRCTVKEVEGKDVRYFCGELKFKPRSQLKQIAELNVKEAQRLYRLHKKEQKQQAKEEDKPVMTSFVVVAKIMYEQVVGGQFIYMNDGEWHTTKTVTGEGGIEYCPINAEEVERGIVKLPVEPLPYGTPTQLMQDIKNFIQEWLDVDKDHLQFATWYVMLTWVYQKCPSLNYLRALGDTGCGKSRYLDTIGFICYKPITASGAVTVAALKRITDKWRGTILVDEADFKDSDENNELIKYFNLGFEQGKVMMNVDKNDPSRMEFFDPFCPKIIATRKQFRDQALEARCLTEVMKQTSRKDIRRLKTKAFEDKQLELRNKLLQFRYDYLDTIKVDDFADVDMGDVEPRIEQATRSFLALFSAIPGAKDAFLGYIKEYNQRVIDERSQSWEGQIINGVVDLVIDGQRHISSRDVEDYLKSQGFDVKAVTVGRKLSAFGVGPVPKKVGGKTKKVIPLNSVFLDVVRRYCVDVERLQKVTVVTEVTVDTDTPTQKKLVPETETEPKKVTDVTDVTDTATTKIYNKASKSQLGSDEVGSGYGWGGLYHITVTTVTTVTDVVKIINQLFENHKTLNIEKIIRTIGQQHRKLVDTAIKNQKTKGNWIEPRGGTLVKV